MRRAKLSLTALEGREVPSVTPLEPPAGEGEGYADGAYSGSGEGEGYGEGSPGDSGYGSDSGSGSDDGYGSDSGSGSGDSGYGESDSGSGYGDSGSGSGDSGSGSGESGYGESGSGSGTGEGYSSDSGSQSGSGSGEGEGSSSSSESSSQTYSISGSLKLVVDTGDGLIDAGHGFGFAGVGLIDEWYSWAGSAMTSDDQGNFTYSELAEGTYTLSAGLDCDDISETFQYEEWVEGSGSGGEEGSGSGSGGEGGGSGAEGSDSGSGSEGDSGSGSGDSGSPAGYRRTVTETVVFTVTLEGEPIHEITVGNPGGAGTGAVAFGAPPVIPALGFAYKVRVNISPAIALYNSALADVAAQGGPVQTAKNTAVAAQAAFEALDARLGAGDNTVLAAHGQARQTARAARDAYLPVYEKYNAAYDKLNRAQEIVAAQCIRFGVTINPLAPKPAYIARW